MTLNGQIKVFQFQCNISMSNCPIAFKFYTAVQSQSKNTYVVNVTHMIKLWQLSINMTK